MRVISCTGDLTLQHHNDAADYLLDAPGMTGVIYCEYTGVPAPVTRAVATDLKQVILSHILSCSFLTVLFLCETDYCPRLR